MVRLQNRYGCRCCHRRSGGLGNRHFIPAPEFVRPRRGFPEVPVGDKPGISCAGGKRRQLGGPRRILPWRRPGSGKSGDASPDSGLSNHQHGHRWRRDRAGRDVFGRTRSGRRDWPHEYRRQRQRARMSMWRSRLLGVDGVGHCHRQHNQGTDRPRRLSGFIFGCGIGLLDIGNSPTSRRQR